MKHNQPVNCHFSLRANCTDFIAKYEWPPNSPDFNVWECFRHVTNFSTQSPGPFRS